MAIRDPNIAAGFQALAAALFPDSQGLIEADLARHKRDNIIADTNRTNVDATRLAADRARLQAEADRTRNYIAADQSIAAILADPAFDPASPAWRAKLAAAAAGAEGGLSGAMPGLTGAATFVNPGFAGSADAFANILMGTGVVDDYAKTQPGVVADIAAENKRNDATIAGTLAANTADNARALEVAKMQAQSQLDQNTADNARALEIAKMQAEAAMDRLKYSTTTPAAPGAIGAPTGSLPTVDLKDTTDFAGAIAGRLAEKYPEADLSPEMLGQLTSDAIKLFQMNRNADAAVAEVLSGVTENVHDTWWPLDRTVTIVRKPAAASAEAAPAAAPRAAAPITATDAKGRKVMLVDPVNNVWVPLGPVRGQP